MANTSSAKKAERVALRRRAINARRKRAMKDAVKEIGKLIAGKSAKEASAALPALYQAIDKAAKNHTIHRNTAARMKSRAASRLRALTP
jgi:small subunit ribosomal protein S20